jgi:hypothetical protein
MTAVPNNELKTDVAPIWTRPARSGTTLETTSPTNGSLDLIFVNDRDHGKPESRPRDSMILDAVN